MDVEQASIGLDSKIPRFAVLTGLGNNFGSVLFDNFYQYMAIMLGSAGIVQGLLTSVKQLGSALLSPVFGYLSDRFGRKSFLFSGNLVLAIIALIIPFSPNTETVLFLVVFQTLFGVVVVIPSWFGYLGDYTQSETRGTMIGRISSIIGWASNFCLLIIAILMDLQDPTRNSILVLRLPFIIGGIAFLLAAVITLFLPYKPSVQEVKPFTFNIKELRFPRPFTKFIASDTLFTIAWGAGWPLFPYIMFGLSNTWLEIGLLTITTGISFALSQRLGGIISDRIGRKNVIVWSRLGLVASPLLFYLAVITGQILWIFLSNALIGSILGGSQIAAQTLILDTASEEKKASFISIQTMASGLAAFTGSLIMGFILQFLTGNTQPTLVLVGTLLCFVAMARFLFWFSYFRIEDTLMKQP
ncbi:MAG: MFS transporter [Candidatus Hodarchaeota archaeon]